MLKLKDGRIMKVVASGKSDIGLSRENNEDAYFVDQDLGIFIVCDGVGGENAGEVASSIAIEETVNYIREEIDFLEECRSGKYKDDSIFRFCADAVRHSCRTIHDKSNLFPEYRNMGTTLTMAVTMGDRILICHVGDSRAYLVNDTGDHQLSEDHTLVKDFLKKGLIAKEENAAPFMHNILTRSLGKYPSVEVDCVMIAVTAGDRVILCSDGVSNGLKPDDELRGILGDGDIDFQVDQLIKFGYKRKTNDNMTAIVIEVQEEDSFSDYSYLQESLVAEILQECDVYRGLTFSQISRMRSHMEVFHLRRNEVLIQACERYNGFFLVIDGGLMSNGELLTRGEGLGLCSLLKDQYATDDKIAVRDTRLLLFSKKKFDSFSKRYPWIANEIMKNIILNNDMI